MKFAHPLWEDEGLLAISARNLQIVRDAGAFGELPQHLLSIGIARTWIGDFARVEAVMAETESIDGDGTLQRVPAGNAPSTAGERTQRRPR